MCRFTISKPRFLSQSSSEQSLTQDRTRDALSRTALTTMSRIPSKFTPSCLVACPVRELHRLALRIVFVGTGYNYTDLKRSTALQKSPEVGHSSSILTLICALCLTRTRCSQSDQLPAVCHVLNAGYPTRGHAAAYLHQGD